MKLSIIIPMYNAENYIEECLMSILNEIQEDKNFEVILINDGSSDKTKRIIESNIKDSKVTLFNNENRGVSYSRNFGILKAHGDYIMFVDADDLLDRNWYKILKKEINNGVFDIIYFSNKLSKNIDKKTLMKYIIGNNDKNICLGGPCSKVFNRKFLIENNIAFDECLINGEDMLFNLDAILKTDNYNIITESFYKYRHIKNSVTKKFNPKIIENDKRFNEILKRKIENEKLEEESQYSLINGIYTIMDRLSYINEYKIVKNFIKDIDMNFYKVRLSKINNLFGIKKIMIFLIQHRCFFIVYSLFKIKNKIKFINNREKIDLI